MTVLITLTTAGTDSGPFNLYSNLDGYVTPFATGVAKSALVSGYSSSAVPNSTTIIRVTSTGVCTNHIDITIGLVPTTTTTTIAPTTTTSTTATPVPSISIDAANCRSQGTCNDNSTCGVHFPVTITGAPSGYYVQFSINAYTDATASYLPTYVDYTENNALGSVNVTLNLYDTFGGTLLATTTQTLNHQSSFPFLPAC